MSSKKQDPVPPADPTGGQPGPIYDNAMKLIADCDLPALLSVLGVDGAGLRRLNAELPAAAVRPDLLVGTPRGIVHVEFVKDPTRDLGLRMVEYRLRLRRAHPHTPVAQYVLALGDISVPEHYRDLGAGQLLCTWTVVRLSDLDPVALLGSPATAALAALARGSTEQRTAVLAATKLINTCDDLRLRHDLLVAAAILASIVLFPGTIVTALKGADMPILLSDTPLGRELIEEGREEGRREAVLHLTALTLRHRFGDEPRIDTIAARLAILPDEERIARLTAATSLDDL